MIFLDCYLVVPFNGLRKHLSLLSITEGGDNAIHPRGTS